MFARTTKELPEKIKTKYSNTCVYLIQSKIIHHSPFTIHHSSQPPVALITLILLLILAGLTISYITGGGLIDKTQIAMNEYENADKKQQDIIDEINEKNKELIDIKPTTLNVCINALKEKNIITETTGYSRNQVFAFQKYIDLFLK